MQKIQEMAGDGGAKFLALKRRVVIRARKG
jgi:hypothetical protein